MTAGVKLELQGNKDLFALLLNIPDDLDEAGMDAIAKASDAGFAAWQGAIRNTKGGVASRRVSGGSDSGRRDTFWMYNMLNQDRGAPGSKRRQIRIGFTNDSGLGMKNPQRLKYKNGDTKPAFPYFVAQEHGGPNPPGVDGSYKGIMGRAAAMAAMRERLMPEMSRGVKATLKKAGR